MPQRPSSLPFNRVDTHGHPCLVHGAAGEKVDLTLLLLRNTIKTVTANRDDVSCIEYPKEHLFWLSTYQVGMQETQSHCRSPIYACSPTYTHTSMDAPSMLPHHMAAGLTPAPNQLQEHGFFVSLEAPRLSKVHCWCHAGKSWYDTLGEVLVFVHQTVGASHQQYH